jgi:hypothetical protein
VTTTPDLPPEADEAPSTESTPGPFVPTTVDFSLRASPPRMGPALIVIGLVALITLGGVLLAVLPGSSAPSSTTSVAKPAAGIGAVSAKAAIKRIETGGEPPADVVDALVIPE